jgi:hypothetical protein
MMPEGMAVFREQGMPASSVIVILGPVLILGCLMACGWAGHRKRLLRAGFGPEYGRVAQESANTRAADRELIRRKRRHDGLQLRPIGPRTQDSYAQLWKQLQGRFADDPSGAVLAAERLVADVVTARGYPAGDQGERSALLSVEHPYALAEYREARLTGERGRTGAATTEELRKALAQYRVLFGELLATPRAARLR